MENEALRENQLLIPKLKVSDNFKMVVVGWLFLMISVTSQAIYKGLGVPWTWVSLFCFSMSGFFLLFGFLVGVLELIFRRKKYKLIFTGLILNIIGIIAIILITILLLNV